MNFILYCAFSFVLCLLLTVGCWLLSSQELRALRALRALRLLRTLNGEGGKVLALVAWELVQSGGINEK